MQFNLSFMRHSRWAFASGICIGLLLAFPLTAPVWDGQILEPVSTMWGNALGAIGAVAAAVWAADRGASQQERQAAALIHTMFKPIAAHCSELTRAYTTLASIETAGLEGGSAVVTPEEWADLGSLASPGLNQYQALQDNRQRIDSVFPHLRPTEMQVFLQLETDVKSLFQTTIGDIFRESSSANREIYGGPAYGSSQVKLQKLNDEIQQNVKKLEDAAR